MAVESSADSYMSAEPEMAMDYADYYAKYSGFGTADYDNIFMKIIGGLSGVNKKMEDNYKTYLENLDRRNEWKAEQSAREYETWKDSTNYQRTMKDLEAAGLNPYLLINNGGLQASSSTNSSRADYGKSSGLSRNNHGDAGRNIALLLLAVARIAAAFM